VWTAGGTPVPDGVVTVTDAHGMQVGRTGVDAHGRYALVGLPPGTYTAVATSSGFRPDVTALVLNGSGAVHHFALAGDGTITGRVCGANGGLDDAVVLATDSGGRVVGSGRTAPDGTFSLVGLPLGAMTITANAAQHLPAAASVRLGPEPITGLDVTLQPAVTTLTGTVTSANGVPLAGVSVVARDAYGSEVAVTATDETGSYRLDGLQPGPYMLVATVDAVLPVQLSAGGAARADLRLASAVRA
jgi:hypothetical protein